MLSQRSTLPFSLPRFSKRLALAAAIVSAAAVLVSLDVPTTPAQQLAAVSRPAVEIVLSVAPASGGTVVLMDLPATSLVDLHPELIERPGMERRLSR